MSGPVFSPRKPLDGSAVSVMTLLCLCWGFQQVAIKMAAPYMDPVLQTGFRSFFAALLVAGLIVLRRESVLPRDGTLRPGIIVGLLFGMEFVAISFGLHYTTASHMAVFLYTAPVFAAVGLHCFVKGERLGRLQWWGVLLAFSGVGVGYSGSFFTSGGENLLLGDALGIAAAIMWAMTTVCIRTSKLSEAPPTNTLLYQLAGAAVILLPLGYLSGYHHRIIESPKLWANLAFQTVVIAFGSYLLWFGLLRKYLANRLSVFSLLTPFFGVVFGVVFLKEPLDIRFAAGAVLVLAGIGLVNCR